MNKGAPERIKNLCLKAMLAGILIPFSVAAGNARTTVLDLKLSQITPSEPERSEGAGAAGRDSVPSETMAIPTPTDLENSRQNSSTAGTASEEPSMDRPLVVPAEPKGSTVTVPAGVEKSTSTLPGSEIRQDRQQDQAE